jgi:hypothetical protein
MAASYLGQSSPSGRIAILFLLQAADEIRKVQRFAQRVALFRAMAPGAPETGRAAWQGGSEFQPLRRAIEELLVVYDWSETWIGLNLCLKPAMDELFLVALADRGRKEGDYLLGEFLGSLLEDSSWQRAWTAGLVRFLREESGRNAKRIDDRFEFWLGRAREALAPLAKAIGSEPERIEAPARAIFEGKVP